MFIGSIYKIVLIISNVVIVDIEIDVLFYLKPYVLRLSVGVLYHSAIVQLGSIFPLKKKADFVIQILFSKAPICSVSYPRHKAISKEFMDLVERVIKK